MAAGVRANPLAKKLASARAPATVIHFYGLTESVPTSSVLLDLKGVDGVAPVEPLPCAGLVCWISRVPEADFAQNLAKNMQDLDWLAAATTRHQEIVSAIAQTADILPARFGIEFLHEKSLQAHIESRERVLKADFDRIRGKEEWGIKIFALPLIPLIKKKIRSGKEYLQAKSTFNRREPARDNPELLKFGKTLQTLADEVAEGGKFAAARRDLEFHKTVLLKRNHRKKLESLVRAYSRKWKNKKRIECTGPWPPFSFVSHTDSSERING